MTFVKGDPNINRKGRPKEKTIKERVRDWLEEHPEDMQAFVQFFVKKNRDLAWQMLEGKPQQDITSKGERLIPRPLDDVQENEGVQENKNDALEDSSGAGRDGGE